MTPPPHPPGDRPRLICLVGTGHSGSTLLGLMLGAHSRVHNLGEADRFDDYFGPGGGLPPDRRGCTCRAHVDACPFWRAVRGRLEPAGGPTFRLPRRGGPGFAARNAALFAAAALVSGKPHLCDGSKDPERVRALAATGRFDCRVVHLVRDGRAVAYSYRRLARRGTPEPPPWDTYFRALRGWARVNARCGRAAGRRPLLVRYEDLVGNPERELTRVLELVGCGFEPGQLAFRPQEHHDLGGNRMKMGEVRGVRADTEYRAALGRREWYAGTALVARSLRRYRYPFARPGS